MIVGQGSAVIKIEEYRKGTLIKEVLDDMVFLNEGNFVPYTIFRTKGDRNRVYLITNPYLDDEEMKHLLNLIRTECRLNCIHPLIATFQINDPAAILE